MAQTEFPSNSKDRPAKEQAPKEKTKDIQKVTTGEVIRRKKPLGRKFTETFFGGGDAKTVWAYVFTDVMVPGAKDIFLDVMQTGLERMILGESRRPGRRYGARPGDPTHVSYNRMGGSSRRDVPADPRRPQMSRRARTSHDFDEIVLATRVEAEEVIDRLYDLISRYETATVADLYDLLGIEQQYTDDKWGWYELPGARWTRVRNGYLLDLPRPEPLD